MILYAFIRVMLLAIGGVCYLVYSLVRGLVALYTLNAASRPRRPTRPKPPRAQRSYPLEHRIRNTGTSAPADPRFSESGAAAGFALAAIVLIGGSLTGWFVYLAVNSHGSVLGTVVLVLLALACAGLAFHLAQLAWRYWGQPTGPQMPSAGSGGPSGLTPPPGPRGPLPLHGGPHPWRPYEGSLLD